MTEGSVNANTFALAFILVLSVEGFVPIMLVSPMAYVCETRLAGL